MRYSAVSAWIDLMGRPLGRSCLGVGVTASDVSAVVVERDSVRWAESLKRDATASLAESIVTLLNKRPGRRWPAPAVMVAVGSSAMQLKQLRELQADIDSRALKVTVQSDASQFFLANGVPLTTTGVRLKEPGTAWVAAIEAPVVMEIQRGCRAAHVRLIAIVPTAVAMEAALEDTHAELLDGGVRTEFTLVGKRLERMRRRLHAGSTDPIYPAFVPALRILGERAAQVADAFGASRVSAREPLALSGGTVSLRPEPARRRIALAATICVFATLAALFLPGLVEILMAHRAETRLAMLSRRTRVATESMRVLNSTTAELGTLALFEQSRQPMTVLLSDIGRALPDGSALAALQVDSTGIGSMVALAPRAAQVVDAMERVPGIASPSIVGPITQEVIAGHALERVTVRFTLVPASERAAP